MIQGTDSKGQLVSTTASTPVHDAAFAALLEEVRFRMRRVEIHLNKNKLETADYLENSVQRKVLDRIARGDLTAEQCAQLARVARDEDPESVE